MKLTKVEILRESIKIVISALTEKRIPVSQAGARAYVEWHPVTGKPKRINIPYVPDNASDRLIKAVQGFVDHECAHILFTEFQCVKDAVHSGAQHQYNVLEDTYIERRMKKMYAGSTHNLVEVWSFIAEEMIKGPLDRAIASGNRASIVARGLPVAIHAWAGNTAAQEFMGGRWDAFSDIEKIIGTDLIEEIPKISSSREALKLSVAIKNRLAEWKNREEEEERAKRRKEMEKEDSESGPDGDGEGGESDPESPPDPEGDSSDSGEFDPDDPTMDEDAEPSPGDDDCPLGEEESSEEESSEEDPVDVEPESKDFEDEGEKEDESAEGEETPKSDQEDFESTSHVEEDPEKDEDPDESEKTSEEDEKVREEDETSENDSDDSPPSSSKTEPKGDKEDSPEDSDDGDDPTPGELEEEEDGCGGSKDESKENSDDASDGEGDDSGDELVESPPPEDAPAGAPEETPEREVDMSDWESEVEEIEKGMEDMEDMESLASALIEEDMGTALANAEYWPLTKDGDKIERYTPKDINRSYVQARQLEIARHIGILAKHLERMVTAKSFDRKIPGFRSGKLDGSSLYRVATGDDRVFRRDFKMTTKDVDVQLVIDLSGSMYGRKVELATECGYALGTALDRLNINNQIVGFTTMGIEEITHHVDIARESISSGSREPSRIEPIYMPIIKDWSQRFTADRKTACIMAAKDVALLNNIDGESIEYAGRMLWAQPGARKLMIVLSDGNPIASGNHTEQVLHLRNVIDRLIKEGTEVFGIGIKTDSVSKYYPDYAVVDDLTDLLSTVMGTLSGMLLKNQ